MESLLIYILKSAGLLSIFYVLYMLLLKNDTSFTANRNYLLGGIFASIVLPSVYFTKKVLVNAPEIFYNSSDNSNYKMVSETTSQGIDWWMIAGSLYLIITGFFLLRFCFRIFQILKMIHFSEIQKEGKYKLVETKDTSGPFSFFNYIFINPKEIKKDELHLMLTHEKVHARQLHSVDMILSNFITAVLWFNPISWFYQKIIEQNLEFIADSETAQTSECVEHYQHVLVKVSTKIHQPALVNHFYQSFIKKRILMLNKKNPSSSNSWKYHLILPLLAIFIMSFNVKTTTKLIESSSTKTTEPIVQKETLTVTIAKTTTKESLEKFKSIFLKWDVELNFDTIEYTKNGKIITAIKVKFKNLNSGETGVLIKKDPDGIQAFEIYVNKNNKTGFRDITSEEFAHKNETLQLKEIGKNPLYIIKNKEYSSSDLDAKTIATKNKIDILKPKDAVKRFGSKASDGAIIVVEGKIISDFKEELERIDENDEIQSRYFIEIHKNELPIFINLSKNRKSKDISTTSLKGDSLSVYNSSKNNSYGQFEIRKNVQYDASNTDSINGKGQVMNVNSKDGNRMMWVEKDSLPSNQGNKISDTLQVFKIKNGNGIKRSTNKDDVLLNSKNGTSTPKPLIILDGKVMPKDYDMNKVAPADIKYVNVLKGNNATSKYGDRAMDGAIEISTKFDAEHPPQEDVIIIEDDSQGSGKIKIAPNHKDILIVVNGKIKKSDFDINSINPDEIKGLIVLKGKFAIKKYGKKGEKGVVEITLKEKN